MASGLRFDEDMHVHSTFSDGKDSLADNARSAIAAGITRLGCVDHVRRDTPWVRDFVSAVRNVERELGLELIAGVEAKLLDEQGTLDLPGNAQLADYIYVADHQMPWAGECRAPKQVAEHLRDNPGDASRVIERLVAAYVSSMLRYQRLVLAHPFSILPKIGLHEGQISESQLSRLVDCALRTGTIIEVDERWRCPSARVVKTFLDAGVAVWSSSDSHQSRNIGQYVYLRQLAVEIG